MNHWTVYLFAAAAAGAGMKKFILCRLKQHFMALSFCFYGALLSEMVEMDEIEAICKELNVMKKKD
jgi:hypothetical protein